VQQSLRGAPGQRFELSITDSEISSLVSSKLAQYGSESPVQDPIIWFTRGKIHATGHLVNVLPVEANFYLVAQASVEDGRVVTVIERISAGSVPIPESVLGMLSRSASETIDELQLGITITGLQMLEGEVIIRGTRQ
jgi:uncharacterized protein YpmS